MLVRGLLLLAACVVSGCAPCDFEAFRGDSAASAYRHLLAVTVPLGFEQKLDGVVGRLLEEAVVLGHLNDGSTHQSVSYHNSSRKKNQPGINLTPR